MRMQMLAQTATAPIGGPLGFRKSELFLNSLGATNESEASEEAKIRERQKHAQSSLENAEKLLMSLAGDTDELQLFRSTYSKWKQGPSSEGTTKPPLPPPNP